MSMKLLNDHKLNGVNEQLEVQVIDKPGHGGASHRYNIRPVGVMNESDVAGSCQRARACVDIHFQEGPINEHGINGVTHEALLAVIIDRLRSFQAGEYACIENAVALEAAESCLRWLQYRTKKRLERGVEGTSVK